MEPGNWALPSASTGGEGEGMRSSMSRWWVLLVSGIAWFGRLADAADIAWTLQTRDAVTGAVREEVERVDPARVGVIAVDVWNFHWCKTATMRVDAIVPRLDAALEAALRRHVGLEIGPIARPDIIRFTDALPKTRSGKIMRRILRSLAAGQEVSGDTSTLEDRSVLDALRI
jgi:hypothetical protein